jgi:hypothetical protein
MASNNDYDSDLAGDTLTATKAKQRQTSFDQTNLPAQYQPPAAAPVAPAPAPTTAPGPIGRVAQQLPANPAQPAMSLESLRPTSIGDGRSAIYAGVGANGEASFSNTPSSVNSLSTNFTAPNQAPDQRLSALPGLAQSGSVQQQTARQYPTSLADLSPGGRLAVAASQPQQASALTDALPGYTATPAPLSPAAQQQASLGDAWRGGSSSGPGFAALGSAANMGDGVGTFSQANQGAAALAMGRFQKAADLRQGYKDQDRLENVLAAQTRDRNFNVVRDSTQPLTRKDMAFDLGRALTTENLGDAVKSAQGVIAGRQEARGNEQQLQRTARLEDLMKTASAPDAGPDDLNRYLAAADPKGYQKSQLDAPQREATLAETQARTKSYEARAARDSRNIKGLPAGLQKFEDDDVEAIGTTKTINGALDSINTKIADGSLPLGIIDNTVSATRNALGASDEASANYASFQATLEKLRNDSLRLNKGTQTNDDAVRAWNELITNIKDPKIVQQRIKEITGYNNAASEVKSSLINNRRKNQGLDDLNIDEVLGRGQPKQQPNQQDAPQQSQDSQQPQQPQQGLAQPRSPVYSISTDDQFARLPSGADFIDPQGNHRRKP